MLDVFCAQLMRYKGVLNISGDHHRVVLQGVHMLMDASPGARWKPDEIRESRLVFIGKNLPQEFLISGLNQCLVRR